MNNPATNSSFGLGVENPLESEERVEGFFLNANLTILVFEAEGF